MGLTKEMLTPDFVKSGQQPTFKPNFEFALINPVAGGSVELTYFNRTDLWFIDYERTQNRFVINNGAALAILSQFITEKDIPEFGIPMVQQFTTNVRSGLNLTKEFKNPNG